MKSKGPRRQGDPEERPDAPAPAFRRAGLAAQREAWLKEQIERNLQRAYRETLEEPVPDRFLALIAELRDKLNKS